MEITYGHRKINFNLTLAMMDNAISNKLNCRLSPLATDQNFFDAYVTEHKEKFKEDFLINDASKERYAERIKKITDLLKVAEKRKEDNDRYWLNAMISNEPDKCAYLDNEILICTKEIAEFEQILKYALFTSDSVAQIKRQNKAPK